jgi:hypothetical protein
MENYHDLDYVDINYTNRSENSSNFKADDKSKKSNASKKSEFSLSNPIFTEMIDFKITKDDAEYEFQISFENQKWLVKRNFSEIKNLISTLRGLKYSFLSDDYFQSIPSINQSNISNINIKEVNIEILNFLKYINYRYDVLSNILIQEFLNFSKSSNQNELMKRINEDNLEQIFNFKLDDVELSVSDFVYDPDLGLLIISLEDVSIFSRIGRFWSLIEYEILGSCLIFQRVFDKSDRPYFRKILTKNFDARVSCLELNKNYNKIFVGLENGAIQIFNINIIEKSAVSKNNNINNQIMNNTYQSEPFYEDKIIIINEGNNFRFLSDRITSMTSFSEFLFISSKENKLIIIDVSKSIPSVRFNGSLKTRIKGKGHIKKILIDSSTKRLFVVMITNLILVYNLITLTKFSEDEKEIFCDIKIEHIYDFETSSNIKDMFVKGHSVIVALENKIQIFNTQNTNIQNKNDRENLNEISLDGSLPEGISFSSKYVRIDLSSHITSICYFTDSKLIFLGLSNGILVAFNSRSIEIIFAKKIFKNQISKLILLEENYIIIAGDDKGNIHFFKFG